MSTWQTLVTKMVRLGRRHPRPPAEPEPLEIFYARPPSGRKTWPRDLPFCDVLREFYTLCDGGMFWHFDWLRLRELKKARVPFIEWAKGFEDGEVSSLENCLVLASHDAGELIWDAGWDRVSSFNSDGMFWEQLGGRSLVAFLEYLFTPKPDRFSEMDAFWTKALNTLESLP